MRGRRPKSTKPPTKIKRQERLKAQVVGVCGELESAGFLLAALAPVDCFRKPILDPKTGGSIAHVEEELGTYIQRVKVVDNLFQRQPYDHLEDKIYRRLIRDFIEEAAMPETKVAAMSQTGERCGSLTVPNVRYSVIDGLQRLYCFCIALLLVWKREKLLADQCITQAAWDYMKDIATNNPDSRAATQALLKRVTRYEIFWNITQDGLLHYMVTFNTGQRSMDVQTQLEIMRQPLLSALENQAGIAIYKDTNNIQRKQKPKDQFAASDLILAARAFVEYNPQLKKPDEAESQLEAGHHLHFESKYDVGEVSDLLTVFRTICIDINEKLMERYADDLTNRYILSGGGVFLVGFIAACGKMRYDLNMASLTGALERMQKELARPGDDPLDLIEYQSVLDRIKSSRGRSTRRLIYDTFLRFFNGTTPRFDWADAARQMSI